MKKIKFFLAEKRLASYKVLKDYLSSTSYSKQVVIKDLGELEINKALFCTAVDNLIRNGLKYNDSSTKKVTIFRLDNALIVQDNGLGMTQEEFLKLSQPYTRGNTKHKGTGLGLNICVAIVDAAKLDIGSKSKPTTFPPFLGEKRLS